MIARALATLGPRRIGGQIALLVVATVVACQLVTVGVFHATDRLRERPGLAAPALSDRFAEFAKVLDLLPAGQRAEVVAAMASSLPSLRLRTAASFGEVEPTQGDPARDGPTLAFLERALAPSLSPFPVASPDAGRSSLAVGATLSDGSVVTGLVPRMSGPPGALGPGPLLAITLGLVAAIVATLLWWAMRALAAPLEDVAAAAEAFSLDQDPTPLKESGPDEMRATARALNRMQSRVSGLVADRTRMLAAVGHDLRTPITRMRLRAELVEDPGLRGALLRDLAQMGSMVDAALSYLRGGPARGDRSLVDVASLLQTVCDDFADMEGDVTYEGPDHLVATARVEDLRRAIANLVENALKHARPPVRVSLRAPDERSIEIAVSDCGEGIPPERRAAMLEPFARGDAARDLNDPSAGFGLGLAIADAVARAEGGELTLHDATPGRDRPGLEARLRLPIHAASGTAA